VLSCQSKLPSSVRKSVPRQDAFSTRQSSRTKHKFDSANAVELHPAFEWLSCRCNDEFEDIKFVSTKGDTTKTWKLARTSAAKKYATIPAPKNMRLRILDFKEFTVTNRTGVTVMDALAGLWANVFSSDIDEYQGSLEPVPAEAHWAMD